MYVSTLEIADGTQTANIEQIYRLWAVVTVSHIVSQILIMEYIMYFLHVSTVFPFTVVYVAVRLVGINSPKF